MRFVSTLLTWTILCSIPLLAQQSAPLGNFLNPDGSLRMDGLFKGSLDPKGWKFKSGSNGAPRFVRESESANPADTAWHAGYSLPGGVTLNGDVYVIAVSGTNVYLGGSFYREIWGNDNTEYHSFILMWDGEKMRSLGDGLDSYVYALTFVGADLYVGGQFTHAYGPQGEDSTVNHIAKWNGSGWSGLGSGTNATVWALASDGSNIYAGGSFLTAGGSSASSVAKWNGTAWSNLGAGVGMGLGFEQVAALSVIGSDLYAGGSFTTAGGNPANNVAKWDGANWSALGSGLNGSVSALRAIGSDLYVGGAFTTAGGGSANNIAKWNGSTWASLGSGLSAQVLALTSNGSTLYAGGNFFLSGSTIVNLVAKWDGSSWSALGTGVDNTVRALAHDGTNLYAGGLLQVAGGDSVSHVAKWTGSKWSPVLGGIFEIYGYPAAVAVRGTDLYVGGTFDYAGGVRVNNIAKWDGSKWVSLAGGLTFSTHQYYNIQVTAMTFVGPDLYVGGLFDRAGSVTVTNLARWDGINWWSVGSTFPGSVNALASSGSNLYASGAGGTMHLGMWDGTSWTDLNSGGNIYTIAVSGDTVYAGGRFGYSPFTYIHMWDGSTWSDLGTGVDSVVFALALSNHTLYAGGVFRHAGGSPANYIAKWDGTNWSPLDSGITQSSVETIVRSILAYGTDIYVGGEFLDANGIEARCIAMWDGHHWSTLGSGTNWVVDGLASDGSSLFCVGYFDSAGSKPAAGVARWTMRSPTTDADSKPKFELPSCFSLEQNTPNPFNPSTVIRYQLPSATHVTLRVYNLIGQEVARLVDEFQDAGFKSVRWDAGEHGSGVYFYMIQAGTFVETRKMLLMR